MTEGSIDDVAARLELWCRLTPRGLALVEFHSEPARQRVVELLKAKLSERAEAFHELSLSQEPTAIEVVQRLVGELEELGSGVVSVSGFGPLFPPDCAPAELVSAFNFNRERLAAPPSRQIWWMPRHVVEAFRAGASDLYSWFRGRWHLRQSLKRAAPSQTEREFFEMGSSIKPPPAPPEPPPNARRRVDYLVERFKKGLADQEATREQLERQLLHPAIEALSDIGATSAAKQLEELLQASEATEPASIAGGPPTEPERLGETEAALRHDLEFRKRTLGENDPETARSLNDLANFYAEQGRYAEAETLYRRALAILDHTLGKAHPHVAQALNNLANLHAMQSRGDDAQRLYERALSILEQSLGSEHPYTQKVRENLDDLRQAQRSAT